MKRPGLEAARARELDERERYALEELRKSMGSASISAEGVGEVLPEAVAISQAEGGMLPKSMVETTERAIGLSVEQDPAVLSDALFPVIGSAIRKALERFVAEAMFKLDAGLQNGLSPKRFGWRIEALRSGVPYYEIVLRHTLDYRVEHAFLIHKQTGVLLADASMPGPSGLADKDLVASMLTAVRDYIKDSLSLRKEEAVDVLSAGGYSIFVEEGPLALIALVVRGTADPAVRERAQDALETAHARLGPQLRAFDGEMGPFEKAAGILSPCLVSAEKGAGVRKPVYAIVLLCLLAATGCLFGGLAAVRSSRERAFVAALDAEPGIVVIDARHAGGRLRGTIMRAVGARPVESVAAEKGFDMAKTAFSIELYVAGTEAASEAAPPAAPSPAAGPKGLPSPSPSVAAPSSSAGAGTGPSSGPGSSLSPNSSPGAGSSPNPSPSAGPGSGPHSSSGPVSDSSAELEDLTARLASKAILFGKNSRRPIPGQEGSLRELRSLSSSLVDLARRASLVPRIEAVGRAAGSVSDAAGDSLSVERARNAVELVAGGDSRLESYFVARGAGNSEPVSDEADEAGAARNRSVSFTAIFR